jgi:hypothetical protein
MARLGSVVLVLVSCSFACSSPNDEAPSPAGNGGTAAGCLQGDTQKCYGPGACTGAQVCQSDRTWGHCDCGTGAWPGIGGSSAGSGGEQAGGASGSGADGGAGAGGARPACVPASGELDLRSATIYDNPPDLADWPVTTTITELVFQYNGRDGVHVKFSKQDGEERWPDMLPPGWDEPLQYTMGMAECIDGKWYASAVIQFWYGLEASGGNIAADNQVAENWYYTDSWWGEMAGYQPRTGEPIGIFVVAGNLRHVTDGSQSPVKERSNVVLVPMPDVNGATHGF